MPEHEKRWACAEDRRRHVNNADTLSVIPLESTDAPERPTARFGSEEKKHPRRFAQRARYCLVLVHAALVSRRVLGAELLERVGGDRVSLRKRGGRKGVPSAS